MYLSRIVALHSVDSANSCTISCILIAWDFLSVSWLEGIETLLAAILAMGHVMVVSPLLGDQSMRPWASSEVSAFSRFSSGHESFADHCLRLMAIS